MVEVYREEARCSVIVGRLRASKCLARLLRSTRAPHTKCM